MRIGIVQNVYQVVLWINTSEERAVISDAELAAATGFSRESIEYAVTALVESGLIDRHFTSDVVPGPWAGCQVLNCVDMFCE